MRTDSPVSLTVSPDWLEMNNQGTIIDRFYPGATFPCPNLRQDSIVRVRKQGASEIDQSEETTEFLIELDAPRTGEIPSAGEPPLKRTRCVNLDSTSSSGDVRIVEGVPVFVTAFERRILMGSFRREARLARVAHQQINRTS